MPLHHLYFVGSAFLVALGSVLARYLLTLDGEGAMPIDPLPFLTLQLCGGVTFLIIFQVLKGWQGTPLVHYCRAVSAGIILGAGSVGTIMALSLISASEASVIFAVQPILILVLAWILLGERFGPAVALLSLIAVSGVVMIVLGGKVESAPTRLAGLSFAFLSTICAALYVVWMRGLNGKVDYLTALIIVQLVAGVLAAAMWGLTALTGLADIRPGNAMERWSAFATGAIYYGVAFYIYLIGLQKTEASKAGVYLSLVPVFAIGLASIFLLERMSPGQWAGALLVVGAVTGISFLSGERPVTLNR